tara:strand:+ start:1043 stop:1312 length:270 start_codon:yes stop_codon:yes gene_type:complete
MSKGSNPTNVTTTTASEPSEFIRPYYTQAIDAAQQLYENPNIPSFFPNNTFVDFAPETETALQLATVESLTRQSTIRFFSTRNKQSFIR